MRPLYPLLLAVLTLTSACNHAKQDKEAVRDAVVEYAKTKANLDLSRLDVQVASVNFHDREATAVVSFRDKSGASSEAMEWSYNLESQGDKWIVKGKGSPVGASGHGAGMGAPAGGAVPPSGALPPGHPSVSGGSKAPQAQNN